MLEMSYDGFKVHQFILQKNNIVETNDIINMKREPFLNANFAKYLRDCASERVIEGDCSK